MSIAPLVGPGLPQAPEFLKQERSEPTVHRGLLELPMDERVCPTDVRSDDLVACVKPIEQTGHRPLRQVIVSLTIGWTDCTGLRARRLSRFFDVEENGVKHGHDDHREEARKPQAEYNGNCHGREKWILKERDHA